MGDLPSLRDVAEAGLIAPAALAGSCGATLAIMAVIVSCYDVDCPEAQVPPADLPPELWGMAEVWRIDRDGSRWGFVHRHRVGWDGDG